MKRILKKYYELDKESKELLPFLYMYQELQSSLEEHENIKINNMYEEEILLQTLIKCWYSTNLDAKDIIDKLLEAVECQGIEILKFKEFDIDELKAIVDYNPRIIEEFDYEGHHCILYKTDEKYLLDMIQGEEFDRLNFKSLAPMLHKLLKYHFSTRESAGYDTEYI